MTLDDLYAEFEKERLALGNPQIVQSFRYVRNAINQAREVQVDFTTLTPDNVDDSLALKVLEADRGKATRLRTAANVYRIARDEGIDKAVLWKLKHVEHQA